jgi:hypothetical protein
MIYSEDKKCYNWRIMQRTQILANLNLMTTGKVMCLH